MYTIFIRRLSTAAPRMPVYYSPGDYTVPLPAGHRFPMERYAATQMVLREAMGLPPVPAPPAYFLGPRPHTHASGGSLLQRDTSVPGMEKVTAASWETAQQEASSSCRSWHASAHCLPVPAPSMAQNGILSAIEVIEPQRATLDECGAAHALAFVNEYADGSLPHVEHRRIGFDWSPAFVQRTRRITGGTIAAARFALGSCRSRVSRDGVGRGAGVWVGPGSIAANHAGGTHHAFPRHGEGFCIFNDAAVAARLALYHPEWRREFGVKRVLILDLDVHQGNGTGACFARGWREACGHNGGAGDAWAGLPHLGPERVKVQGKGALGSGAALLGAHEYSETLMRYDDVRSRDDADNDGCDADGTFDVLTVSVHGAKNYPWATRYPSLLDVDVPDGAGDEEYATILSHTLDQTERIMRQTSAAQLAVRQRMNESDAWDRIGSGSGSGSEVLPPRHLCDVQNEDTLPIFLRPAAVQAVAQTQARAPVRAGSPTGPLLGEPWYVPGRTLLLFQAGVDPLRHDRLGRLGLSRTGLHARNEAVFRWAERMGMPTVVSMGGGYSKPIEASARAHTDVFMQAAASFTRRKEQCSTRDYRW